MSEETARPQDLGRSHHRSSTTPAPETVAVLDRYRAAMRLELDAVLEELRARRPGLLPDVPGELVVPRAERLRLWDLAIKLGRELAGPSPGGDPSEDVTGPDRDSPVTGSRRSSRSSAAPRLSARERRALGG